MFIRFYLFLLLPPVAVVLTQFLIAYLQKNNRQRKVAGIFSIIISSLYLAASLIICFPVPPADPFKVFLIFPAVLLMGIVLIIGLIVLKVSKKEEDINEKKEKRFSYTAAFLAILALGLWIYFFAVTAAENISLKTSPSKLQKAYQKALNKNPQEKEGDFYMLAQNPDTPSDVLAGMYKQNVKSVLPIEWFILTNPNTEDDIACKILNKKPSLYADVEKNMRESQKSLAEYKEIPNLPAHIAKELKKLPESYERSYNRSKYLLSLKCPK